MLGALLGAVALGGGALLVAQHRLRPTQAPALADVPLPASVPPGSPTAAGLRLTVFGTSLSAATPSGTLWPDRLAAALEACHGRSVTLTRVARPGAGSAWALTQIGAVAAGRPDLVLIEFAINDADRRDGVSVATSRAQHVQLLASLSDALPDAQTVLMAMNPVTGPVQRIVRGRLGRYHAFHPDVAQAHGAGFVDLSRRWRQAMAAPDWPTDALPDGLHPRGEIAAAVIVPALIDYLGGPAAGTDCHGA